LGFSIVKKYSKTKSEWVLEKQNAKAFIVLLEMKSKYLKELNKIFIAYFNNKKILINEKTTC
jgi:hypothetical protein